MQTELAVMQFQFVNGLNVTGVADSAVLDLISSGEAAGRYGFDAEAAKLEPGVEALSQLSRRALAQLGQDSSFEDSFDFVSYIYLKCGLPLIDRSQLHLVEIEDRAEIHIGQALFIRADGREFCGIATSDGALVCRDENGYIVMRYLDMMDVESIYGSSAAGAAA